MGRIAMSPQIPPTAAYLTEAFRRSAVLNDGRVLDVVVQSDRPTLLSRILRLRLTCDRAEPDAPETIILKTGLANAAKGTWNGGRQEVEFYTKVAPMLTGRTVPRCFDAQWNAENQAWHLLLEDLTDTHVIATQWPLPPTQPQCEAILTARARLQAAWWDDPRLGVSVGHWINGDEVVRYQRHQQRNFASFADRLGDNLSARRRELYERFLSAIPRLFARYHTHRNVTICQGDSHVWNCFLSRDGGDDVRFFDWDFWRVQVSALDLAYMMAVHWYPDCRQRMERPLLDHYHAVLLTRGVNGYDRRALDEDYRRSVLWQLMTPLSQAATQIPTVVWWNNLERVLMAVDDLGCREFLDQ
jgi:hypothetical protein